MPYIDHATVQVAGEVGFLSAGLGKQVTPRYSLGLMYGVVPPELSDAQAIETVTLRQTYRFYDWDRLDLYAGFNLFHVLGLRHEASKFSDVPSGYYPINGFRGLINLGSSVAIDRQRQTRFYFEAGINDLWLVNFATNTKTIAPSDYVSLCFGWKTAF